MQEIELEITNPTGLHTRPGTEFVRLAKTFVCDVEIHKEDKTANAKSIIKLLKIGISQGDRIRLICQGEDETAAIEALADCIRTLKE